MVSEKVSVEARLMYKSYVTDLAAKLLRAFSPRLIPGVHYAFNGPVHAAVQTVGNLTAIDFLQLRICNALGLPNKKLETKLRAIGNAFSEEAELLEAGNRLNEVQTMYKAQLA